MNVTDEKLRQALIEADKQGNTEDAKILAAELQRRQTSSAQQVDESGDAGGILPFLNKGIAGAIGAPVDVINAGMGAVGLPKSERPFGGSESIRSMMGAVGIPTPSRSPETIPENIAQILGETATITPPMFKGMQAMSRGAGAVGSLSKAGVREFVDKPLRTLSTETAAASGAGAAGQIAREQDASPSRQMLAELGGGIAGTAAAALSPARLAISAKDRAMGILKVPFSEAGAFERASKRVRSLVNDPVKAAQQIEDLKGSNLMPSARTDEPGLMALEKAVLNRDPAEFTRISEASQKATDELVKEIKSSGNVQNTKAFLKKRRDRLERGINARVESAADKAASALDSVRTDVPPSVASKALKTSLDEALADMKIQEAMLWKAVPQNAPVPTQPFLKKFDELRSGLSISQSDDMPEVARRLSSIFKDGPSDTTILEMDGLYKKLGEVERSARSSGEFNTARLANELRDSALESMSKASGGPDVKQAVDAARSFSLSINNKFRKGTVGKIMGYAKEGGTRLPPESAIRSTIGPGSESGSVAVREIGEALGGVNELESVQTWLKARFMEKAVREGSVVPASAQGFIRQYSEVLDNFPALKSQFQTAEHASDITRRLKKGMDALRRKYDNPNVSALARFLRAPAHKEVSSILNTPEPDRVMGDLISELRGNLDAMDGLKSSISDFIVRNISKGSFSTVTEKRIISGMKMKEMLDNPVFVKTINQVYKPREMKKLRESAEILARFERQRLQQSALSEITADAPGRIINIISGVLGAKAGAMFSTGAGASIQSAQIGAREARRILRDLTVDKAQQLLIDAVEDPELMKALLLNPGTATKQAKQSRDRVLRAWAVGVGSRLLDEDEESQ